MLTARPEFRPPWTPRAYVTPLTLTRFLRPQVEELALRMTAGKPLPAEVLGQIVEKTDGIPLFVEELVKTILESGLVREEAERYVLTGPLPPLAIPTTLQDALMARLDRLAPAKAVAQLGAVLGREFAYEILRAVAPLDEATLQYSLAQLVEAELLYRRGMPPQATYLFKHALVQDAAYASLLKSTRQQYHQRIAQVLEEQFSETAETQPELLAHHCTEAGLMEKAVHYWYHAGQSAAKRSAHAEAMSHLRTGLALLQTLPETSARTQHEVDMLIALGASLRATQGSGAPAVGETYTRARQLCAHLEDPAQMSLVLRGLWNYSFVRGELQTARVLGEHLLVLAQPSQDAAMRTAAHHALGVTLFFLGAVASAHTHVAQGVALYDPKQHRASAVLYGDDVGVICHLFAARALWFLGSPDQGLAQSQQAVTLAQQFAHPFSVSYALSCAAMLHQLCRQACATQERAEAANRLATDQGFPLWVAYSAILCGWALAQQG